MPCHRAIDAAGQQKKCFAVGTYRHTAGALDSAGMDKAFLFADFHTDNHIGVIHIHAQMVEALQ